MVPNVTEISKEQLLDAVAAKAPQGCRFVTITCTDLGDAFDLIYSFDLNYRLQNLRLRLPKGQDLPSISHIYFAAVLVENELKDLFGIPVKGLVLDYEGRLLLAEGSPKAPQAKPAPAKPGPAEGVR